MLGTTTDAIDVTSTEAHIAGGKYGGSTGLSHYYDGKISNLRLLKGTALYTQSFIPPLEPLNNITNTKLLCCQSDSSATAATAIATGSITAVGDPTAGAQTVALSGTDGTIPSTITWPSSVNWNGGSAPTLITNSSAGDKQQFQFLTRDSGLTWYAWEPYKLDVQVYQLWTWGTNSQSGVGALGLNNGTNISSPAQVGTEVTWRSLAKNGIGGEGAYMSSGIKGDGTLWIWGDNEYGSLGQNNTTDQSSPVQIPGTTWDMHSLGRTSVLATKTDGTLWVWGRNDNTGQLGKTKPQRTGHHPLKYLVLIGIK